MSLIDRQRAGMLADLGNTPELQRKALPELMMLWLEQQGASGLSLADALASWGRLVNIPPTKTLTEVGVESLAPTALRELVLAGGISDVSPLVATGDSHTDDATGAQHLWNRLQNVRNQPGEGLEDVPGTAIVPLGNNGQTLASYLTGAGTNNFAAAMALNPSVVLSCWLTNDVRQGGLGLTVPAIEAAGAALLNQHVANIKAARPNALIVLRIPAPYLTINSGGLNYITDGTNINPDGLAQIYTTGVRAAHYAVRNTHPDVLIYDPQARLFGTTSPTALGTMFADQIHQSVAGYEAEGDDFAAWVAAAIPYSQASTNAALGSQPYTPWLAYHRSVEDSSRFVRVASGQAITVTAGNTFLDFGPTVPDAAPENMIYHDIVEIVGAETTFKLSGFPSFAPSASNTRISLQGGQTVPASAVALTKLRVYRQTRSGDAAVNAVLDAPASFRKVGRITAGGTTFMDVNVTSLSAAVPAETSASWVAQMQSGDRVYVEGRGDTPITLTTNFAVSGTQMRITGLSGFDWSTLVGRIVVVYRP